MKVYIVTSGSYSDYSIEKVFTDKTKAEEYAEWLYDSNPVAEYDTEDDMAIDKYYKICIQMRVYDNRNEKPQISIQKECEKPAQSNRYIGYWDAHKYNDDYFEISIIRWIEAQNWNEEFYVNKYTKAIYDLIAIVKQMRAEGATENDIQQVFDAVSDRKEE